MKQFLSNLLSKIPIWIRMLIVLIGLALAVAGSWLGLYSYPNDNKIEEAVEQVIEDQTGVDIDLTPETEETSQTG